MGRRTNRCSPHPVRRAELHPLPLCPLRAAHSWQRACRGPGLDKEVTGPRRGRRGLLITSEGLKGFSEVPVTCSTLTSKGTQLCPLFSQLRWPPGLSPRSPSLQGESKPVLLARPPGLPPPAPTQGGSAFSPLLLPEAVWSPLVSSHSPASTPEQMHLISFKTSRTATTSPASLASSPPAASRRPWPLLAANTAP